MLIETTVTRTDVTGCGWDVERARDQVIAAAA